MVFERVTLRNIDVAAQTHSVAWQESHKVFCSEEFVQAHTPERQKQYILEGMEQGKQFWLLIDREAKGVVSVKDDLIADLYVLPTEQRKGYGAELLRFAEDKCCGNPCLWILSNNKTAEQFYLKQGFRFTGNRKILQHGLRELEMEHIPQNH